MKSTLKIAAVAASFGVASFASADAITTQEVEAAQQAWGNGIVTIGKAENPQQGCNCTH